MRPKTWCKGLKAVDSGDQNIYAWCIQEESEQWHEVISMQSRTKLKVVISLLSVEDGPGQNSNNINGCQGQIG